MWSDNRNYRLAFEKKVLAREFPEFAFIHKSGELCAEGWQNSTIRLDRYRLTLIIPPNFPDEEPQLYITYPKILFTYHQEKINDIGCSHNFHTIGTDMDGYVQICLGSWNPSNSLVIPLLQGKLWLKAYDEHLVTGEKLCDIIDRWKRRQ